LRHNFSFLSSSENFSHRLSLFSTSLLLSLFSHAPNGLFLSSLSLSIISGCPSHRRPQTALVAGSGPPSSPFPPDQKTAPFRLRQKRNILSAQTVAMIRRSQGHTLCMGSHPLPSDLASPG